MREKTVVYLLFAVFVFPGMVPQSLPWQRPLDCCKTCGMGGQSQWGTRFSWQCQVGQNSTPCIWRMCDMCIMVWVEVAPGILERKSCCPLPDTYCSSCTGLYFNDPFIDSCYGLPLCPCNYAMGGA